MFTTFGGSPGGPGGSGFGPSTGRDAYSLFRTPAAAAARTGSAGAGAPPPPPPPSTASRRLSLTKAGGPGALPPPPLAALRETTGEADGGAANGADAIIEELYAYASDPANYPSGGAGAAASSAAGGGAYEAFASQSPAQKRGRLQRRLQLSHGALMRRHAELSTQLDNTGRGGGGDDGRFLTWVAATILNPDGAVIRRALADGENVDSDGDAADEAAPEAEEEAGKLLARRLGEALDGLAASVRDCLPSDGEEEAQPSRAMLRVLLERNGGGVSNHGDAGSLPLGSYLALPGRVRAALGADQGPGSGIHTSSGHSKRRRLHLHGGGYAASSSSSAAGRAATAATAAETTVAAVLAYVLAEYLASASCPFFFVGSDDSTNGPPSPTWDLLRACTVHAASAMGLAAFLPAVRAGLVCYGLDRLADDAAAVCMMDMAVEEEEEEDDDGDSERRIIVEGLSPVAVVDLILSDSG